MDSGVGRFYRRFDRRFDSPPDRPLDRPLDRPPDGPFELLFQRSVLFEEFLIINLELEQKRIFPITGTLSGFTITQSSLFLFIFCFLHLSL